MSLIETRATDVRHVFRQIHKKPAFAGLVVLVLAAGFAVSTAMFSTIRTVLLNPLPYRSPERLVQIVSRWPKTGDQTFRLGDLRLGFLSRCDPGPRGWDSNGPGSNTRRDRLARGFPGNPSGPDRYNCRVDRIRLAEPLHDRSSFWR